MAFEIAGKAAEMADPGQGAFDDPTFGDHLETGDIVAFDNVIRHHLPVLATVSAMIGP